MKTFIDKHPAPWQHLHHSEGGASYARIVDANGEVIVASNDVGEGQLTWLWGDIEELVAFINEAYGHRV